MTLKLARFREHHRTGFSQAAELNLPDNSEMPISTDIADWNSFGRANASQKWRRQSAAMGSDMTQAIVEAATVQPGMRVLDIACGTGEPAISLAALLAGSGEVVGIDVSPAPLKIAEERALQRGLTNASFQQADAHKLPFPDNSFDRITSRLGVMFFSDLPRALSEMQRVLKPGGRAVLLVWGPMDQPYFHTTIGTLMRMLQGAVIPESGKMFAFADKGKLAEALRQAGFSQAKEESVTVPWTWLGTPEEVWQYFQDVAIPFASFLQSIPAARRAETDAAVIKAISQYSDGTGIKFTATVNIAVAVK